VILLDTHAWVWFANESAKLSRKAIGRIRNAGRIAVCTISYWEIARLVSRGNLTFDRDLEEWFEQASSLPRVEITPMSPTIGARLAQIGDDFHGDPADRIIAATAMTHRVELITRDEKLHAYTPLRCVW
jgi:PIN domain nuclease of toxin-antitoxin system